MTIPFRIFKVTQLFGFESFLIRSLFSILLIIIISFSAAAQLKQVVEADVDGGAKIIGPFIDKKILETVRFVALGELQRNNGHRESIRLNTAIAAHLIQKKSFNNYIVDLPDWMVRNFNQYLIGETKTAFSRQEFDTLFDRAFASTRYFNEDFKRFAIWLKKYNLSKKNGKVKITGVGFVIENSSDFSVMNNYFIETYIRPYDLKMADSISIAWKKNGNSNSNSSDAVVVADMEHWQKMVENRRLILDNQLLEQLKSDVKQRSIVQSVFKSNESQLQKLREIDMLYGVLEQESIKRLMGITGNKLVYSSSNNSFANAQLYLYDMNKQSLPLQSNGIVYRDLYKESYVNTVIASSDSAEVIGIKGNAVFQPIVIPGDELTKKLRSKKEIYYLPDDGAELTDFQIPVINSGTWGAGTTAEMKNKSNLPAFDVLFIFQQLTKSTPVK